MVVKHVAGYCISLLFAFSVGLLLASEPAGREQVTNEATVLQLAASAPTRRLPVGPNGVFAAAEASSGTTAKLADEQRVLVADPSTEQLDVIFASLTRLHRKGELDMPRLVWRAAELLIGGKEPQMANEMIAAVGSESSHLFELVGRAFDAGGYDEDAYAMFVKALRLSPGLSSRRSPAFRAVLHSDPNLALQILETAAAAPGFEASRDFRASLVRALIEVGRTPEAQRIVESLLEGDPSDAWLLGLLERTSADAAEVRYRALVLDDSARWSESLAGLLFEAGRLGEGLEVLDEGLREKPGDLRAISTLTDYLPAEAERRLLSAYPKVVTDHRVALAFEGLGDAFMERGDSDAAVQAWSEYLRRCGNSGGGALIWPEGLEDIAPDVLFDAVESRLDSNSTADFYGDLAGLAWRTGKRERAVALWQEAKGRFPDWEEWQLNLDAAAAGQAPPELWQ